MKIIETKVKNIIGVSFIIFLSYIFYKTNISYYAVININLEFNINFLGFLGISPHIFKLNTIGDFLGKWGIINYFLFYYWIGFVLYYSFFTKKLGKAYYFWTGLFKLIKKLNPKYFYTKLLTSEEKLAVLSTLVKIIYLPLMFAWFFSNGSELINSIASAFVYKSSIDETFWMFYYKNMHFIFFYLIIFLDVTMFFIGYCFETKFLKNKIKSVDTSLLGWASALFCYPLLNSITQSVLNWYSSNIPSFVTYFGQDNIFYILTTAFGLLGILLMGIYAWASLSLGFKASNLTNRGIINYGPYKYIRHPAYITKNFFRIIGCLPLLIKKISVYDFKTVILILISLIGRILLYHLRAITEENHLSNDPEYISYKKQVKYMYIPGII